MRKPDPPFDLRGVFDLALINPRPVWVRTSAGYTTKVWFADAVFTVVVCEVEGRPVASVEWVDGPGGLEAVEGVVAADHVAARLLAQAKASLR